MPAQSASPPTAEPRLPPHFGQNLAGIFIVLAVLGLIAGYALQNLTEKLAETPRIEPGEPIGFTLAATELKVPENWLRAPRGGGFTEAIDLIVPLDLGGAAQTPVRVTLLPRARAAPSAALLDTLYIHRFTTDQADGPRGLIGKPLLGEAGYQNETVWYDPVAANPFVAKCLALGGDGENRLECMRTLPLGRRISAVATFDGSVLEQWQEFDAALAAALQGML